MERLVNCFVSNYLFSTSLFCVSSYFVYNAAFIYGFDGFLKPFVMLLYNFTMSAKITAIRGINDILPVATKDSPVTTERWQAVEQVLRKLM